MAGFYTTPLKPTVVERSEKHDGNYAKNLYMYKRVLDLSVQHLSTLKASGKGFPHP